MEVEVKENIESLQVSCSSFFRHPSFAIPSSLQDVENRQSCDFGREDLL